MNSQLKTLLGVGCMIWAGSSAALDTSEPFLCAVAQVNQCVDGLGCESILPEMVNAPTFIWIDISKKRMWTNQNAAGSKIASLVEIDGRHILQGAEDGNPKTEDGAGWTMSIEDSTARFSGAIAIQQATVSLFGACTELP